MDFSVKIYRSIRFVFGKNLRISVQNVSCFAIWRAAALTFVEKESSEKNPFFQYRFTLYDTPKIIQLTAETPFKIIKNNQQTEFIKSNYQKLLNENSQPLC